MTTLYIAEMFVAPWPVSLAATLALVALVAWRIYKDRLNRPD